MGVVGLKIAPERSGWTTTFEPFRPADGMVIPLKDRMVGQHVAQSAKAPRPSPSRIRNLVLAHALRSVEHGCDLCIQQAADHVVHLQLKRRLQAGDEGV
jgi:hypothetical protein